MKKEVMKKKKIMIMKRKRKKTAMAMMKSRTKKRTMKCFSMDRLADDTTRTRDCHPRSNCSDIRY